MSFALVFAGQGTQHAEMLPWVDDDAIVRGMCARLGIDDWRAAVADASWSERNANAQTLLTGLALSAWHRIAADLPPPAAIAGYSVGEVAAFSAAGVYDAATALELSQQRAAAMDRCAAGAPGGLLSASGVSRERVDEVCRRTGLAVAIRTGEAAFVLGGPPSALDAGESALAAHGARCQRLRVGVASHTPWMQGAAEQFARILDAVPFDAPRTALFSNVADRVRDAAHAKHALAAQIASTVRWDACMDDLQARNVGCVLEVGPGSALARLWNARHPDVPARSCDDFRSAAAVVRWVSGLA
jgi:[acyl-carrier-protein] S-malonyltransferase